MNQASLLPSYGGQSLEMLFPSIAGVLGVPGYVNVLDLPPSERFVVLVVDGLGHDLLDQHAADAPYLSGLMTRPAITCGVPSTTANSLTSLGTGLAMGQHGVTGYTSRIPGTTTRLNALLWDQDVDPTMWQPHPTVLETMQRHGVTANVVNTTKFANSGLTRCSQRGVPFRGVDTVWERLEAVLECSEATEQTVVYAYESELDHTGHVHGCNSGQWSDCLRRIDRDVRQLRDSLPHDVVLLVTADHGMIDVPAQDRFDLDQFPGLRNDVILVAGEARFRHIHTRDSRAAAVAKAWGSELGDRALVRTFAEAEAAGWFGAVTATNRPRIGDVVVASLGDFAVFSSTDFPKEMQIKGVHGSLTPAEMRVPLMVDF